MHRKHASPDLECKFNLLLGILAGEVANTNNKLFDGQFARAIFIKKIKELSHLIIGIHLAAERQRAMS